MKYKTRIAPSPTGNLHLGTARTAYMNYIAARATNGIFILRIDDTDQERNSEESLQNILDCLSWLEIEYDEIHYQSKRHNIYKYYAYKLIESGLAVRLENGAIALTPKEIHNTWYDEVAGEIKNTEDLDKLINGMILVKGDDKDNSPTYHFASVCDDWDMDVNFVLRGVDHIPNTIKQITIWQALNTAIKLEKPLPKFNHVGLVFQNKKKLSKRDSALSILSFKEEGFLPESLRCFMIRLGWGPHKDDSKEAWFIDKDRAKELFLAEGNLRGAPSNLDLDKLRWIDRKLKHIQRSK